MGTLESWAFKMTEVREGYKKTEIGIIPVEWEVVKLDDISKIIMGQSPKSDTYNTDNIGMPLIQGNADCKNRKTIPRTYTTELTKECFIGDIIMTVRAPVGAISKSLHNACIGRGVCSIKSKEDNEYIYHYLVDYEDKWDKLSQGSTFTAVSGSDIKNIKIPLPPLKEQEKIADVLSTADEKIDAIELQIQKAETLKKGLLQKLLSEGIGHSEFKASELGKIPVGWEVIPFLELADKKIKYSFTGGPFGSDLKSEHYTDSGVRVIQLQNIGDGHFINKDFVYTSEEKAEALKSCQIYPNDIILAKMAEPVARACIIPNIESKYLMGSDGIRLHIDKSKFDTQFIYQSINFNRFRDIAIARSTGTTRLRIGLTALKKIPISIPPLEEQKQIADILSAADEKVEVLRAKKEKYETLKKGLLQKLLSGEVRV